MGITAQGLVDDPPRAVAATPALIAVTEYCTTSLARTVRRAQHRKRAAGG